MAETAETLEPRLFDPVTIDPGRMAYGLPENVERYVAGAARNELFGMKRYSYDIGDPDELRDVEFNPDNNTWSHCVGCMGSTMTAQDIARSGAQRYMADRLGAGYFSFPREVDAIAGRIAEEYNRYYPPKVGEVLVGPGY
jgi:hypothetical protein